MNFVEVNVYVFELKFGVVIVDIVVVEIVFVRDGLLESSIDLVVLY